MPIKRIFLITLLIFACFTLNTITPLSTSGFAQEEELTVPETPTETPAPQEEAPAAAVEEAAAPSVEAAPAAPAEEEKTQTPEFPKGLTVEELQKQFVKTEAEEIALGPKSAKFFELFAEFRTLLKELNRLKLEYQTAKPARLIEIDKIYDEKLAIGRKLEAEVTEVALEAFEEAPFRSLQILRYLYGVIEWESNRENYENALRIFRVIEKHGLPEDVSNVAIVSAALSAFKSMDFETAERLLNVVMDFKVPEGQRKSFLESYIEANDNEDKSNQNLLMMYSVIKENWEVEKKLREADDAETDPEKMQPRVLLKTTKGDIVVELFENEAPNTVANFISLVEKGYYDGTPFHRVLHFFMAQGGDPEGTGAGGPGYTIADEFNRPNARKHFRGSLSMANMGRQRPNSGGSQFFLTFVPTFFLDGQHTVFGRVVEGIEVLADIKRVDPEKDSTTEVDRIIEAKVLRKRSHEYVPVTGPEISR